MTENGARVLLVECRVHGRVLVDDAPGGGDALLVGFHGYGENAERHLELLRRIPRAPRWRLAAVQALHPFYNTKTGDVVGSWMTKQDREQAIEDNVAYVRAAIGRLRDGGSGPLVIAGFSQGVAMAWRAAARGVERCDGVIALGGDVPPELADRDLSHIGAALVGRGARDEWYSEEKQQRDLELLARQGVAARPFVFDAAHEWTPEFDRAAGDFLAGLA